MLFVLLALRNTVTMNKALSLSICVCMYIYVCVYVHIHVHVYIYHLMVGGTVRYLMQSYYISGSNKNMNHRNENDCDSD